MLYHDAGLYSDAKKMFEAEVEIAGTLQGVSSEHLGTALNHLGLIQLRLQEYPQARESLERALDVLDSGSAESELLIATILNNRALVDLESGRYADAEASLRKVCALRGKTLGEHHPDYEQAIYNLATCLIPQRRFREAIDLLQRAAAIDDVLMEQVFSISSEDERLALTGMVRQRFELFLAVLSEVFRTDTSARQSAFDLVLRRKCIVFDAAAAQRLAIHAEKYPELKNECAQLSALAAEISRMMMDGPGSVSLAVHEQRLADLRRRAARIEADLSGRIPEMRAAMLRRKEVGMPLPARWRHTPQFLSLFGFLGQTSRQDPTGSRRSGAVHATSVSSSAMGFPKMCRQSISAMQT